MSAISRPGTLERTSTGAQAVASLCVAALLAMVLGVVPAAPVAQLARATAITVYVVDSGADGTTGCGGTPAYGPDSYPTGVEGALEAAIVAAGVGGTVHLCTGIFSLTSGEVNIGDVGSAGVPAAVHLVGEGTANTIVRRVAVGDFRLFHSYAGSTSFAEMSLENGHAPPYYGGAIYGESGGVSLYHARFAANYSPSMGGAVAAFGRVDSTGGIYVDNTADTSGGAIDTASGGVTSRGDLFIGNSARSSGAIQARGGETVTVRGSVFVGNHATEYGAGAIGAGFVDVSGGSFVGNDATGIYGVGGALFGGGGLSVRDAEFVSNVAVAGGAIAVDSNNAITVIDSTFDANRALTGNGGAIRANHMLSVTNSTFTDNSAGANGGAISAINSDPQIFNSTFLGNRAELEGGATYTSRLRFANSIFGSATDTCRNTLGDAFFDLGGNIAVTDGTNPSGCIGSSQTDSTAFTDATLIGFDPAGLANNGGPTETIEIDGTGVAADYGIPMYCYGLPVANVDQRGEARNATATGGTCSSGAYEVSQPAGVTLDVSAGTGGSITSGDGFIDCGTTCNHDYSAGSTVSLTATPDSGYVFGYWTDCDSPSANTCAMTMDVDKTAGATFWQLHTLTVTPPTNGSTTSGDGLIDCGSTCSHDYTSGSVTLHATPALGYAFGGWTGCDASSGATCTMTMNADKTTGASFTQVNHTITYTGPTIIYEKTTGSGASIALSAQLTPQTKGCPVRFTVDPSTGIYPYPIDASTGANGIVMTGIVFFPEGEYSITVSAAGACAGTPDFSGSLSVVPGSLGKGSVGGGWYKNGTPPKINLGYQVAVTTVTSKVGKTTVTTTTTKGNLLWIAKSGWRLKGTVSLVSTSGATAWAIVDCPGSPVVGATGSNPKCGTFNGSGVLQQWDVTANGGLGGWITSNFGTVSFVVTAYDGGQATTCKTKTSCTTTLYPDWFGITMKQGATPITSIPVSSPIQLSNGEIRIW